MKTHFYFSHLRRTLFVVFSENYNLICYIAYGANTIIYMPL